MKRKFLLGLLISCSIFSSSVAQINKGSVWLGGSLGVYNTSSSATGASAKQTTYFISPAYGKAIEENLIVGATLNYAHGENTNTSNSQILKQTTNTYGAGVFIRKYVQIVKGVYLFGNAGASLDLSKQTSKNPPLQQEQDYTTKGWAARVGAAPGLSFRVNKKLHLETGFNNLVYINYDHSRTTSHALGNTYVSKGHTLNAGASLNNLSDMFIGFRLLLSKS